MDFEAFLDELRSVPDYAGQVVYVREVPARPARFADPRVPLPPALRQMLRSRGIERLYCHQAEAVDRVRGGESIVVVTGTASGKTLCYALPILEGLLADRRAGALLLFPTKALCQDQFRGFASALTAAGLDDVLAGVYDGDTPSATRRRLRDGASVIFSNPDMVHAALMPQHGRWSGFLSRLKFLVLDELHTYSGIFGSNMTNLLRRLRRVCRHYGSEPQIVSCSATMANPKDYGISEPQRKVLENRFTYHAPHADQLPRYAAIRAVGKELAKLVMRYCPVSRERGIALDKIQEATMWANAAIACGETEEPKKTE